MKVFLRNIAFVIVALFVAFPIFIFAQTDSVPENYFLFFQKNIEELSENHFSPVEINSEGKFKTEKTNDFSEKYTALNPVVFPGLLEKSAANFQFFNSLSENEKRNLIRSFSFYEKEMERILKKENLPTELKFLAPALSAMNEKAVSTDRAGVWQITHFQTVLNGGEINRLVDERFNVLLSSRFAAIQLKQNLQNFKSTELAVIALFCGNTKLKNILAETGGNADLNLILSQLPEKVSEEIAAFQAMKVFLTVNKFIPVEDPFKTKILPDTVLVFQQLHFQQIEKVLGIKSEQIQALNPQYKFSIIPESKNGHRLTLPNGKRDDFVLWNDSIKMAADSSMFQIFAQTIEYPPAPNRQYLGEPIKDLVIEGKTKIQYRIKTGDVLGIIAENYDVDVADLKYWNNISNERRIQAGQKLDIFVPDDEADYFRKLEKTEPEKQTLKNDPVTQIKKSTDLKVYDLTDTTKKIEHVVKSGESPYIIAKQYDGVTPELILEWNNIDDPRKIQIGQKLIIYPKK